MEVTNGVKKRNDSNEREEKCFIAMEGLHCWVGACEGKKRV